MASKEGIIELEIGMYSYSENFFFRYNEKNNEYDPIFLQGLLFANYVFEVYQELKESFHGETFANFLKKLKIEEFQILVEEKDEFSIFNPEETSPDDIHFFLDLRYSEEKYVFSFEAKGDWFEKELYKLDIVNSVIELLSFLGKHNFGNNNFSEFIVEISNNAGEYFNNTNFKDEDIAESALMMVVLSYDNYINNITFM